MPLLTRPLHRLGGGAKTPVRSLTVTSAPCLATCLATSRRGEQDTDSVSCSPRREVARHVARHGADVTVSDRTGVFAPPPSRCNGRVSSGMPAATYPGATSGPTLTSSPQLVSEDGGQPLCGLREAQSEDLGWCPTRVLRATALLSSVPDSRGQSYRRDVLAGAHQDLLRPGRSQFLDQVTDRVLEDVGGGLVEPPQLLELPRSDQRVAERQFP